MMITSPLQCTSCLFLCNSVMYYLYNDWWTMISLCVMGMCSLIYYTVRTSMLRNVNMFTSRLLVCLFMIKIYLHVPNILMWYMMYINMYSYRIITYDSNVWNYVHFHIISNVNITLILYYQEMRYKYSIFCSPFMFL